jgi:threonine synthase
MRFLSTAGSTEPTDFATTIFRGLAPDGGLYYPDSVPDLSGLFETIFQEQPSFSQLAARVLGALLEPPAGEADWQRIAEEAFPFAPALRRLGERLWLLELFHGPSCAFKDFGASFLATVFDRLLSETGRRSVVLTATSGDTGSAVAQAFAGKEHIDVVILYPSGRVSPLQEKQLTTVGGNVHAVELEGSFDDCQRLVKESFADPPLGVSLTSANSINLGRLLPQSLYYIDAAARLAQRDHAEAPVFVVPSGNFGNLTAGVYAALWGLPVAAFVAATNRNDVVPAYLERGRFEPRSSVRTMSNAMDVGNPSNFDRLLAAFGGDWQRMRSMILGCRVDEDRTADTIRRFYETSGELHDPHTAVGFAAAEQLGQERLLNRAPTVVLGTAHPGKFAEVIREVTGETPEIPDRLRRVLDLPKKASRLGNSLSELRAFLQDLSARA